MTHTQPPLTERAPKAPPRRTAVVATGVILAVVGFVLAFGAIGPLTEHRDAGGYYMSDRLTFDRPSHAIVTGDIDLLRGRYDTVIESSVVMALMGNPDDVRVEGFATGPDALFLGIAPSSAVDGYLSGVAHDEITAWDVDRGALTDVEYTTHGGTAPPGVPGSEDFWVTSVAGSGLQTLDWTIASGEWTAVVMNADASSGVTADLAFGAAPANVGTIAWTALTVGLVALIGGVLLLYLGLRHRGGEPLSVPVEADVTETPREASTLGS